ncbi:MAG: chemotaxis protein CheA [Pseudomonadota bacterium]
MYEMEGMEDILQDFLVEAGEILIQLDEQLVLLESRPQDRDLLNAIFRGFHTIKGGAGFLNLEPLVEVCHRAENVFNVLRQGQRLLSSAMMDVILFSYDTVKGMLDAIAAGKTLSQASPELLAQLDAFSEPEAEAAARESSTADESVLDAEEEELETIEEALETIEESFAEAAIADARAAETEPAAAASGDEITDEEFEALLDALHASKQNEAVGSAPAAGQPAPAAAADSAASDEITEDEFEALLDRLHGKSAQAAAPAAAAPVNTPRQAPAADSAPRAVTGKPAPAPTPAEPQAVAGPTSTRPAAAPIAEASPAKDAMKAPEPTLGNKEETTIRVDTRRLDEVMNLVGELVLVRNRILTLEGSSDGEGREAAAAHLDLVTSSLQAAVMKTRMQPIKKVFGRFPRLVRDLAKNLGKEIELVLQGEDTDLDKTLVEELADPLVHLVRNAVDHGIETPEERLAAGKPATGRVLLSAQQEGDHILITISDDGRGMNPEVLKRKALEKGVIDEETAARLDERQAFNLIFAPGFSTKEQISDVSGRGVGMDVVKTHITRLNGAIDIHSRPQQGSTFLIRLPLTLAIIPTLMVGLGNQTFALPLSLVREIFHLDMSQTRIVNGQQVALVREEVLPLGYLAQWLRLGYGSQREGKSYVVVAVIGEQRIGLVVDSLYGQEEVVIKSLGVMLQHVKGFAGATITGNGHVVLILDVPNLLNAHGLMH